MAQREMNSGNFRLAFVFSAIDWCCLRVPFDLLSKHMDGAICIDEQVRILYALLHYDVLLIGTLNYTGTYLVTYTLVNLNKSKS